MFSRFESILLSRHLHLAFKIPNDLSTEERLEDRARLKSFCCGERFKPKL